MRGDLEWGSIPGLLASSVARFPDNPAVVDEGVAWTFADLADQVDVAARALIARGTVAGDRVAIWAPNIPEWIVAALATHSVGATLVPMNTRYKGREAAYILRASGAKLLFTVTGFLGTDYVDLLRDGEGGALQDLETIILLRGDAVGAMGWADFLDASAAVSTDELEQRRKQVGPDDVSDIMFTSGTTGHPKGVVSTHGQSLRTFEVWSRLVGLNANDRYLVVNPFFHTFGYKAGFLSAIMRGAVTIPHAVFDADAVLRRIGAEQVTMLPGPPALYQSILNHPELDQHDISSLRLAVTGAATIPVSLIEQMRDRLGFDTVLTAYGLTEATGVVTMCREGDDPVTIATTSGCAIEGVEVRTVDAAGSPTPPGDPGEVVVRGFNVMREYLDDPEQTAAAVDAQGWLHTGDIGVLDARGYLDITDRLKDMFIVGGFNAYPAEIENELVAHPAISQAAVVGMPDQRLGEVGCAFVIAAAGTGVDEDEVRTWARERMANFKVPRRVVVMEALPANASGKVLKNELRQQAATLADGGA